MTEPSALAFSASLICANGNVVISSSNGKTPSAFSWARWGMNSLGVESPSITPVTERPLIIDRKSSGSSPKPTPASACVPMLFRPFTVARTTAAFPVVSNA